MNRQELFTLVGAATLTCVLGACARTPEPERAEPDAKRDRSQDTRLCERYAQAAKRVIKRQNSEPIDFLRDVEGSRSTPGGSEEIRFAPPWTVKWSCTQTKLSLRARLPNDLILSGLGNGAQVRLNDLVRGIRQDGLDPKADKLWVVVELVDADDIATFDPRKPYSHYR